jgi:hypothetical protein
VALNYCALKNTASPWPWGWYLQGIVVNLPLQQFQS